MGSERESMRLGEQEIETERERETEIVNQINREWHWEKVIVR